MTRPVLRLRWFPHVTAACLLVGAEFWLGPYGQKGFSVPVPFLLLSLGTGAVIVSAVVALQYLERRTLRNPNSPLVLTGLLIVIVLLWILGWNHPWTYAYLLVPLGIVVLQNPRPGSPRALEFRWLMVLAVSLAGPGLLKLVQVTVHQPTGIPWRGLVLGGTFYLLLRAGGPLYDWAHRPLVRWRRSLAGLAVLLLLVTVFVVPGDPAGEAFRPYFNGRVATPGGDRPGNLPNIILISLDTLRWDRVPGSPGFRYRTPALESLRRDSVGLSRMISTSSWTLPSHASLFTGLMNEQHGAVVEANSRIYASVPSYTQYLRRLGYATAAFTDGVLVRRELGFSRGFDVYWEQPLHYRGYVPGIVAFTHALAPRAAPDFHPQIAVRSHGRKANLEPLRYLTTNVRRAQSWVREHRGEPFFLFLHTYQVHDWDRYYPGAIRRLRKNHPSLARTLRRAPDGGNQFKQPRLGRARAKLYDYGVELTDRGIAELIGFLKAEDLYEESLIVTVSDHGEGFLQNSRALFHGRGQLDEILIRVPTWLKLPGNRLGGETYRGLLQFTDLFPMIFEHLGVEPPIAPRGFPSGVLRALGNGSTPGGRSVARGSIKSTEGRNPRFFVRSTGFKYTRDLGKSRRAFYRVGRERVHEEAVAASEVPADTRRRLQTEMRSLVDRHRRGPDPYRENNVDIGKRVREELRGMGYLE